MVKCRLSGIIRGVLTCLIPPVICLITVTRIKMGENCLYLWSFLAVLVLSMEWLITQQFSINEFL